MLIALILAAAAPSRAAAEARLIALDRARRAQEAKLAAEQAPLAQLLARAQRLASRPPALMLARPEAMDELLRTRALIAALAPEIDRRSAALRRELLATQALQAETEQALAAAIEGAHQDTGAQDERTLARLSALPSPDFPATPPGRTGGVYRLPVQGKVVVGMGERSEVGVRARGLAIATAPKAIVGAPARARIAYAGPFRGYGDIVILDHGHGWTTLLAGLELVTVTGGDMIEAGAPVGHMGDDEVRLTIELRHNGRPIDVAAMILQ